MEHLRYLERAPLWNLYWWWRYYRAIGWRESGPRKLRYVRRLITAEKTPARGRRPQSASVGGVRLSTPARLRLRLRGGVPAGARVRRSAL